MKVLIQRVNRASVEVEGRITGEIGRGLLLMTCIHKDDPESVIPKMAAKVANMRIFTSETGRFDLSLLQIEGSVLVIPQFTLIADTSKGRRPEFFSAMEPERAKDMCSLFVEELKKVGTRDVQQGVFGAYMKVSLENDGPVTIMVEM